MSYGEVASGGLPLERPAAAASCVYVGETDAANELDCHPLGSQWL